MTPSKAIEPRPMKRKDRPKVTVYVPCHNYGHFLAQAVESVLGQSYEDWELILIDDGSEDGTAEVMDRCATLDSNRVRVVRHTPARGLQACANIALDMARGDYIVRLDAGDYLDENALLVLASYLDSNPDIALVYPNYVYVNEQGEILGVENRKVIGKEAKLLDLPPHGACTMVRKRVLKSVGGYDESHNAQDGHEIWLKVLHRYQVANVSTPLFYYRQHGESQSRDEQRILAARQRIKRELVGNQDNRIGPRIVAVVPAKNTYENMPNIVLRDFAGRPLIDYILEAAQQAQTFDAILVTTDDPRVVEYCRRFPEVVAVERHEALSRPQTRLNHILYDAVVRLEGDHDLHPDILVLLSVNSPLCRPEHIREAVDTLLLYNVDSVISVYEEYHLSFTHGENGLQPFNEGMLQGLRLEREAIYVADGAINVVWRDVVTEADRYGRQIGHVVVPWDESFHIRNAFDAWMIENIVIRNRRADRS